MAAGFIKVKGDKIVDGEGKSVILRGAAIGGWMKSVCSHYINTSMGRLTIYQHGKLHHRLSGT